MSQKQWTAVDQYLSDLLIPSDSVLTEALQASHAAGLPEINVSPPQGKLLNLLVQMHQARTVLEIGTLGGYSTIWLARALPKGGRLVTIEVDPNHSEVARFNIRRAGLSEVVDLRLGAAVETLPKIALDYKVPFDFIFIDADKPSNPEYFAWALKLSRPGTVIICDNVVREGEVVDSKSSDPKVQGTRRVLDLMAKEPRVTATAIQTVGRKGYDGFALAIVKS